MADVESIMGLMMDQEPPLSETDYSYAKKDWLWVPDTNGGAYGSGQVTFDLKAQQSKMIDWSEAYIRIPYTAVSGGAVYTIADAPNIAVRNGGAAIVQDIQVQVNGVTVENSQNVNIAAGVRNLFAPGPEWVESNGRQVMLGLDTAPEMSGVPLSASQTVLPTPEQLGAITTARNYVAYPVAGDGGVADIVGATTYAAIAARLSAVIDGVAITFSSSYPDQTATLGDSTSAFIATLKINQAYAVSITAGTNATLIGTIAALAALITVNAYQGAQAELTVVNQGRAARSRTAGWALRPYVPGGIIATDSLQAVIDLPLKYVSSYFRSLTGVTTNVYHNLRLQMANENSEMIPLHVVGATPQPSMTYANLLGGIKSGGCRLYYPEIKPGSMLASTIADKLQAPGGWVKTLKFRDHKLFLDNANSAAGVAKNTALTFYVTPSILRARRIFLWATPRIRKVTASGTPANDTVRALKDSRSCGLFTQTPLNNLQVSVDNTPYYAQPIESDNVAYQYVKDAFESHGLDQQRGTQLSFNSWRSYYRYYVVDLGRGSEAFDIGRPIQIQANFIPFGTGTDLDGNGQDIYYPAGTPAVYVDAYALVEVDSHVTLNLTSGAVTAIIQ